MPRRFLFDMHTDYYTIIRWATGILGGLVAYLQPTVPYGLICTLAILLDCLTAWQLCKRVRRKHYGKSPSAVAYFTSKKMSKVFHTMLHIYLLIVLAYLVDTQIFTFVDMYLANIVAGAFCFCQIWSVLENESSENDARWAKILQKVMVDKAKRHLDIDLEDIDGKKETNRDADVI